MEFDLDEVDTRTLSEKGVWLPLLKRDGDPLLNKQGKQCRVKLLGTDSNVYRQLAREQIQRRLKNQASGKEPRDVMEEGESDALDVMVACTVAFEGILDKEGNDVLFTPEVARNLYRLYPIIRDQVDAFVSNRANFLLASSKG